MRKTKKKSLVKQAEDLFAAVVRSKGYCEACGTSKMLQCAHIWTRGYKQIAFNLDNALCLCKGHHRYFTDRPIEWESFVIYMIGEKKFASLREKAVQYYKKIDYEFIIEGLKNEQEKIQQQFGESGEEEGFA